jgi:hypothetical protein
MDFSTMQRLGEIRHREIVEQRERDWAGEPLPSLRQRLGIALIALGQKLASATNPPGDVPHALVRGLHSDPQSGQSR